MLIPIDEVVHFDVTTHHPSTGAVTDADSGPTYDVFEESTDTPVLDDQTLTKRTSLTGNYRGSFTASAANGFEAGKWYVVIATATVNSITAKLVAMHFRIAPAESSAGVPKGDVSHFGGSAGTFSSGRPEVNTTHAAGTAWGSGAITAASIATGAIDADAIADNAIDAGAIASDAITAAKIASDAITSAKLADGAITANKIADNAITAAKIAADAITAAKIADGAIDANTFATGAITAAAIAADAIGASELAADAVSEIQSGLATAAALTTVGNNVASILDDTGTSGVVLAAGAVSAAALAADAVDEILDEAIGDGTLTMRQALRVLVAGMAGKLSGAATTTITIRNLADSANVVVATVDADGNRSAVTVTP